MTVALSVPRLTAFYGILIWRYRPDHPPPHFHEPLDDYRLRVAFNDGVIREIDCTFLFHGTLGTPLRDPDYFRQVRVDEEARTVVWPNGLDPAPELLHGDLESPSAQRPHPAIRA